LEDPGVDGKIILGYIFRKWVVDVCAGSNCLRKGTVGGNESSGSIKCREFLNKLKTG